MSKAAVQTVEFSTAEAEKTADQFRALAEKGVEQSKEAYAKLKLGAEDAQHAMEAAFESARATSNEFSRKAIAAARVQAENGFSHLEALFAAKTLSEAMEIQAAYVRKSYETAVEQAKDFQSSSSKAAEDFSRPFKVAFERATKELKVA